MTKKAKFPGLGSVKTIPLIGELKKGTDESDAVFAARQKFAESLSCVELVVAMLDRDTVLEWSHLYDLWGYEELKRKRDLEAAGKAVPEDLTIEGSRALLTIHMRVILESGVKVTGLIVGEDDLETLNSEALAGALKQCGLIGDVARRVRAAQAPTAQQLDC